MARVNAEQGAELLGITLPTFKRYQRDYQPGRAIPTFPPADANGKWLPSALTRWNTQRPGRSTPGAPRPKGTYPCEMCETPVRRRIRDDIDGKLKCRPCYIADEPLAQDSNR